VGLLQAIKYRQSFSKLGSKGPSCSGNLLSFFDGLVDTDFKQAVQARDHGSGIIQNTGSA
jgi:hypothetical protein